MTFKKDLVKRKSPIFLLYKFTSFKIKTYMQAYIRLWYHYTFIAKHLEKTVKHIKRYRKIIGVNFFNLLKSDKKIHLPKI